jgi:hypothetical protein
MGRIYRAHFHSSSSFLNGRVWPINLQRNMAVEDQNGFDTCSFPQRFYDKMSTPILYGYFLDATIPVMIMKRPWMAILTLLTHLVDQHAQRTIEYLKEENRILLQKLGKKRLKLTDLERRRLAMKAKLLG